MTKLMVELDGLAVPLSSCDWVFYEPCGCPRGVTAQLMTHARYCAEVAPAIRRRKCPHTLEGAAQAVS